MWWPAGPVLSQGLYSRRTYQCSKRDLPSAILILYLFVSLFYSGIFMGIFFMVYMAFIFSRTKPGDSSESEQKE